MSEVFPTWDRILTDWYIFDISSLPLDPTANMSKEYIVSILTI